VLGKFFFDTTRTSSIPVSTVRIRTDINPVSMFVKPEVKTKAAIVKVQLELNLPKMFRAHD